MLEEKRQYCILAQIFTAELMGDQSSVVLGLDDKPLWG